MATKEALERKIQELSTLYEVSTALASGTPLDGRLHRIMAILAERLGMTRGTVSLVSVYAEEVQIEVSYGLSPEAVRRGRYKFGEGITGRVVSSGEPMVVPNIEKEPLFLNRTLSRGDVMTKADISFLCVPIRTGDDVVGALSVDRLFSEEISFEEDVRLLTIIAAMIGQAVKLHRMYETERNRLVAEKDRLQADLVGKYNITNIIGNSKAMHEVFAMVAQVAKSNATVLIRGESGTGKELVAHAIHYGSPRGKKPFVKVNCSAIPENLIESELFGHEKGAFTGAIARKPGKFELAEGGTIFLDEIGDVDPATQVKLLRVLQEKEFERVGGWGTIKADVRVVAATNRDLFQAAKDNEFRPDLFDRLNVLPLFVPPLRARRGDIPLLAENFLKLAAQANNRPNMELSEGGLAALAAHSFPGNVRELKNLIERLVILGSDDVITEDDVARALGMGTSPSSAGLYRPGVPFRVLTEEAERTILEEALAHHSGQMAATARALGLERSHLYKKARALGLRKKEGDE